MRLLGKDAHPLGLETVRISAQVRVTDAHSKMGSPFNLGPPAVRAANSGPLAANSGRAVWGWPGTQGQIALASVHNGEPRSSLGVKVGGLKDPGKAEARRLRAATPTERPEGRRAVSKAPLAPVPARRRPHACAGPLPDRKEFNEPRRRPRTTFARRSTSGSHQGHC